MQSLWAKRPLQEYCKKAGIFPKKKDSKKHLYTATGQDANISNPRI